VAAVVLGLAFLGRRARARGWLLVGMTILAAALEVVSLRVLRWSGLTWFGHLHLAFAACMLVLPAAGLALVLLFGRDRSRAWRWALGLAAVVPLILGLYAVFIEPYRLTLESAQVEADVRQEIRVGVLSDLQTTHVGSHERKAVELLMRQNPDLIVLPGDFLQVPSARRSRERPRLVELLRRLRAPFGIYAVLGDADDPAWIAPVLEESGIQLLVNREVRIPTDSGAIVVTGLSRDWTNADARAAVHRGAEADGALKILVVHRPDAVTLLANWNPFDVVISGHTHGGQVNLPFIGALITLSKLPKEVAAGGLHSVAGVRLYVSRGVGVERGQAPPIRFHCRPEVALLRIVPR
jgi:predicted MPP superfamily phosphohydrolase